MEFKPVDKPLVVTRGGDAGERIAQSLRNEILGGSLKPGERIKQEDLAERFGASRVPVREALQILGHEGLVTTIANAGSWVSRLTLEECEEIFLIRERIEPLLLRYSAPGLTEEDFGRMEVLVAQIADASRSGDVDAFLHFDLEFHQLSYSHAQTLQLHSLISRLWNTTAPYRRAYVSSWSDRLRQVTDSEHVILIETLRDQDFEEAERVLENHIRRTRQQLVKRPDLFSAE